MQIDFGQGSLDKILVAVDINDQGEILDVSRECAEEALRTAGQKVSSLVFIHVLNVPEQLEPELRTGQDTEIARHYRRVKSVLDNLVARAAESGIPARSVVAVGVPWFRLIQAVLDEEADLLLTGAGKPSSLWRALFGSTTMKLLRKCPCPVWVTKPSVAQEGSSILVAHDLKEVGSKALAWGAKLAQERGHALTVLHVTDTPEFGRFWSAKNKAELREAAKVKIKEELTGYNFSAPVDVVIEAGSPATVIHHYLQLLPVGLLVMGTVGRTGLSGFITGNTAETLLPLINCSLVAVKPDGFVTPVQARPLQGLKPAVSPG